MHPELADVIYRQRERELEQRNERRRVALERAATAPRRPAAVWPAVRAWWSARTSASSSVPVSQACCASAAA
ncbi:hypothetical protein [Isoptericola sp. NPDC057391]|uniref:hypothetical protein n=1 Tax=Isoptericola sp. NPDC057391 TaxID=3346117 RepID=UPI00363D9F21